MEGKIRIYYPNGDIFAEKPFKNDKVNSVVKVYYQEKNLSGKQMHKNGKFINGKCSNGKAFTSVHLIRLTNEINQNITGGDC